MRFSFLRLLLDPKAGTEGGGSSGAGTGENADPNTGKATNPPPAADASRGYEAALAKHGNDSAAMARTIYADNEKLRSDLAAATAKVPGDGTVVLSKAEAARWTELGKLGGFDEVKTRLTQGVEAIGQVARFTREKLIASAAGAVGYDAEVLTSLAGDLAIEVKEEDKGGKKVKTAEVVAKTKNDKGEEVETRTELGKYAEAHWAKFLPSLKPGASARPQVGGTPSRSTQVRQPTPANANQGGNSGSDSQAPERRRMTF